MFTSGRVVKEHHLNVVRISTVNSYTIGTVTGFGCIWVDINQFTITFVSKHQPFLRTSISPEIRWIINVALFGLPRVKRQIRGSRLNNNLLLEYSLKILSLHPVRKVNVTANLRRVILRPLLLHPNKQNRSHASIPQQRLSLRQLLKEDIALNRNALVRKRFNLSCFLVFLLFLVCVLLLFEVLAREDFTFAVEAHFD